MPLTVDNPAPARLPTLGLREATEGPLVWASFPDLPGFTCESWCYESDVEFDGAAPRADGGLELAHRDRAHPQVRYVTTVTPEAGAVEFAARAEADPKIGGELPDALPGLNLCWQLKCAPMFASAPERYPRFVERCFIFTEAGRTFLHETRRGKIPCRAPEHEYNTPPWVQTYACVGHAPPVVTATSWADVSPDRCVVPVIGAVSRDGQWLAALGNLSAPYVSQAWHDCMHSNPRWLPPDAAPAARRWRVRVYLMPNDPAALLERVRRDFPA